MQAPFSAESARNVTLLEGCVIVQAHECVKCSELEFRSHSSCQPTGFHRSFMCPDNREVWKSCSLSAAPDTVSPPLFVFLNLMVFIVALWLVRKRQMFLLNSAGSVSQLV